MNNLRLPEGIQRQHIHEARGSRVHEWPIGVAGIGILLAASLFGIFGFDAQLTTAGESIELTVDAPARIRDGQLYEMTFTIVARRRISDLVLLVDDDVWRDVTVNTFMPAPADETFRDGAFAFSFGPLDAGRTLVVKVDGQVNPNHWPLVNQGPITVADGDQPLATIDYRMEVLP